MRELVFRATNIFHNTHEESIPPSLFIHVEDLIDSFTYPDTCLPKIKDDLSKLMYWLEAFPDVWREL